MQQSNSPTSSEHFLVISEHLAPTLQRTVTIFLIYFIDFLLFQVSSVQHCNERWVFFYFSRIFSIILVHFGLTVQQFNGPTRSGWAFFSYFRTFRSNIATNGEYFFYLFHSFSTILGHFGLTVKQFNSPTNSDHFFRYFRSFRTNIATNGEIF